eukprot:jgi/Tetstr1/441580/TSEL_029808.t1
MAASPALSVSGFFSAVSAAHSARAPPAPRGCSRPARNPSSSLGWMRSAQRPAAAALAGGGPSGGATAEERGDEKPARGVADVPQAEVALGLASRFKVVQRPAAWNVRYSVAIQDFIETSILAFECGHTEESLRQELSILAADRFPFTGAAQKEDEELFYAMVSIAWLTLGMAPSATVKRWGTTPAVSERSTRHWKGFVQIIVDAYYNKRMAWYPTEPLQMEVMACSGRRAHPADVAEWMRLVYTTLECTIPQFGGR